MEQALSSIAQGQTQGRIAVAIAKRALDVQRDQGDAAVSLLKAAASVQAQAQQQTAEGLQALARETGVGGNVDTQA